MKQTDCTPQAPYEWNIGSGMQYTPTHSGRMRPSQARTCRPVWMSPP
jgi:hypothetical protein